MFRCSLELKDSELLLVSQLSTCQRRSYVQTAEDSLTAALNQGFPVEHLSALRAGFAAIVCCFAEQVVSNVWWDQCSIAGSS